MTRRRSLAAVAIAAVVSASAAACAPATPAPPEGLSVLVYQPRPDVAAGRLAIQVSNAGDEPVEVTGARLVSPDLTEDAVWPGTSSTVRPGLRLDLRAPIPDFDCAAESDVRAVIEVSTPAGTATGEFEVDDPYGLMPRLHAEACVGEAIAVIAAVTPREVLVPAGKEPAVLVLDVAPTGAPGSVEFVAVRGTTLLQPADDGASTPELALGAVLSADGPAELRVPLLPNRCDAHALAEDKVGTIIPFVVDAGTAEPVRWLLVLPDELKGALYGYFAAYCDLDG
jgi:hypothetical protein